MAASTTSILATTRPATGARAWIMPITAGRLFGMKVSNDLRAALFLRLGGSRDFVLAASPLVTGAASQQTLEIISASDVGDLIAASITHRCGDLSKLSTLSVRFRGVGYLALTGRAITES